MAELEKELTIKVKRLEDDCKAYNFTQHTLQEKIKELEEEVTRLRNENLDIINKYTRFAETDRRTIAELQAQVGKMKSCRICVSYDDLAISDWSPCKTCKNKSNWELSD